jgi:hypothetical protein
MGGNGVRRCNHECGEMNTADLANQLHSLAWIAPKVIAVVVVLGAAFWGSRERI